MASQPTLAPAANQARRLVLRFLPKPNSALSYVLVTGMVVLAAAALVSALLIGVLHVSMEAPEFVIFVMVLAAATFIAFWIYCLVHVIWGKHWNTLIGWWLDYFAKKTDWLRSYTVSMRVARVRMEADTKEDDGAGLFLSMAPEQRFPKREATKITYHDDRHVSVFASSRSGKGRSVIIPNLLSHAGSCMVYDPAGELWRETAEFRRKVFGQRTILLDPFNVTGDATDSWNPMEEIDFDNDPFAVDKVGILSESIHDAVAGDPYWSAATRRMLSMVMLYVGSRAIAEQNNLSVVRDLLLTGDLDALWTAMQRSDAFEGLVRRFGEANEQRGKDELASVMEVARTAMKFLDSRPMSDFVKRSTFKMSDLKEGNTSIYIVLPAGMGQAYKAWLRLLFNAAFEAMQDQSTPKPRIPTLLILDEMALMGRMERIQRAAGESAKFGIKMMFVFQGLGQAKEIYGHYGYESLISNSGTLIMFGNNDLETLNYLSARLGKEYYKAYSYSSGQGGSSKSYSYQLRDVGRPDQVEKIVSRQSGEMFVFIQGAKPMRLPRANYDEWDMLNIKKAIAKKAERNSESQNSVDLNISTPALQAAE